jgi:5-methylcytosine-specific restriction endonuclease McrA
MGTARVSRGEYKCRHCNKIHSRSEIQVDHVKPVVPVTGWDDWAGFIERLFCGAEDLQILCKPCHGIKSKAENAIRRQVASRRKK